MSMQVRPLGNTGMNVSLIGLGGVQLNSPNPEYAASVVQRALDLGVNYIDTARYYGDSEIHVGLALKGQRQRTYLSTKSFTMTREETWQQVCESLERLQTDYLDNIHLHCLADLADVDLRTGPGGALEALIQAKEQGMVRHIGCTGHVSAVLIEALKRYDFEIISIPLNIIEREPLDELIPLCRQKGVGITIMKPLATGLLPAQLALKWLANQPIDTMVPGCTTLEEIEENARTGWLEDFTLTPEENALAEALRLEWAHKRCRICGDCMPCDKGIVIPDEVGSDDVYDHYRTMGREAFAKFPWSRRLIETELTRRKEIIAQIESCDRCGLCEEHCPYGLPVMDMLQAMLPAMRDMLSIWETL